MSKNEFIQSCSIKALDSIIPFVVNGNAFWTKSFKEEQQRTAEEIAAFAFQISSELASLMTFDEKTDKTL